MGQGVVERVSADAQSEEESRETGMSTVGQGSPLLRYKTLVTLPSDALEVDGRQYPLTVGMQTTAEILLGKRTVFEYLLSPVKKAWHESGRER